MKFFIISIASLLSINLFGQTGKSIIITQNWQVVPVGKVWKLEAEKPLLIEFSNFDKRSMCGASVLSGVAFVLSGNRQPFKVIQVKFKDLLKAPYINQFTYSITPLKGEGQVFYPGTNVFLNSCAINLEVKEYNITKVDLENIKNIELQARKNELEAKANERREDSIAIEDRKRIWEKIEKKRIEDSIIANTYPKLIKEQIKQNLTFLEKNKKGIKIHIVDGNSAGTIWDGLKKGYISYNDLNEYPDFKSRIIELLSDKVNGEYLMLLEVKETKNETSANVFNEEKFLIKVLSFSKITNDPRAFPWKDYKIVEEYILK